MYYYLPVVSSDLEPEAQYIKNNNCGILVDSIDIDKFSASIIFVLKNKHIANEYGKNGHVLVLNKWNWSTEKVKLLSLYDKLGVKKSID